MDLSKAYYVVKFKHFAHDVDVISEGEEIFNDFSLPIRFRRQEALNYFYELITKNNCDVSFYFIHPDYNREFYYGRLEEFELNTYRQNLLFRFNEGIVTHDIGLWTSEYKHFNDNSEVNFGKLVKVKDGAFQHPVYSDEICYKLGIDFEYYEWE
jgi:hypothetical protein